MNSDGPKKMRKHWEADLSSFRPSYTFRETLIKTTVPVRKFSCSSQGGTFYVYITEDESRIPAIKRTIYHDVEERRAPTRPHSRLLLSEGRRP